MHVNCGVNFTDGRICTKAKGHKGVHSSNQKQVRPVTGFEQRYIALEKRVADMEKGSTGFMTKITSRLTKKGDV